MCIGARHRNRRGRQPLSFLGKLRSQHLLGALPQTAIDTLLKTVRTVRANTHTKVMYSTNLAAKALIANVRPVQTASRLYQYHSSVTPCTLSQQYLTITTTARWTVSNPGLFYPSRRWVRHCDAFGKVTHPPCRQCCTGFSGPVSNSCTTTFLSLDCFLHAKTGV